MLLAVLQKVWARHMPFVVLSGVELELPLGFSATEVVLNDNQSSYTISGPLGAINFYSQDAGVLTSYYGDINISALRAGSTLVSFSGDYTGSFNLIGDLQFGPQDKWLEFIKSAHDSKFSSLNPDPSVPPSNEDSFDLPDLSLPVQGLPEIGIEEPPEATQPSSVTTDKTPIDVILLTAPAQFGLAAADRITNFNPESQSLRIELSSFAGAKPRFKVSSSAKKTKKLLAKNVDFIYDRRSGSMYFNENGKVPGFGDGGIFALLEGSPVLQRNNGLEFI